MLVLQVKKRGKFTPVNIKTISGLVCDIPRDMFMLVVNILTMCGTADFINSIRLIKGVCLAEAKNRIE